MSLHSKIFINCRNLMAESPAQFATAILFVLGFGLIATNAVYSQSDAHVSPFWQTSFEVPDIEQLSVVPALNVVHNSLPTRTVLTHSISLKNVPVPVSSPVKTKRVAAQTSLVREVQALLGDARIYSGSVDGIFGDETKRAIQNYQKTAGIIPDGVASYGLLAHIKSALAVAQVQSEYASSQVPTPSNVPELIVLDAQMVQRVQSGLKEFYVEDKIDVDGIFGEQTRSVLRKFQKRFKLDATGELDEATLNKMRETGIMDAT